MDEICQDLSLSSSNSSSSTNKMGCCDICGTEAGKYRCPNCNTVTCGLDCVNAHKKQQSCDGTRSKSKYIPVQQFTDLDLLSDYRFLESATRCVEGKSRDAKLQMTRKGNSAIKLSPRLMQLRRACRQRQNCQLHFLPPNFDKHCSNTTELDVENNHIFWRVQWVFPHINRTVTSDRVSEKAKLTDLLWKHIDPNVPNVLEDDFVMYRAAGVKNIRVLLKAEGYHKIPRRFYDMNVDKSLVWNLKNKPLVEHPVIVVILSSHIDFFSNEFESEDEQEQGTTMVQFSNGIDSRRCSNTAGEKGPTESREFRDTYDYCLKYYSGKYQSECETKTKHGEETQPTTNTAQSTLQQLVMYSASEEENE